MASSPAWLLWSFRLLLGTCAVAYNSLHPQVRDFEPPRTPACLPPTMSWVHSRRKLTTSPTVDRQKSASMWSSPGESGAHTPTKRIWHRLDLAILRRDLKASRSVQSSPRYTTVSYTHL